MIEEKFSKPSLEDSGYFFKKEKEEKITKKKRKTSGINFNEYGYKLLSNIQMFFLCASLILIPLSLFPLEWVMFEYGRVFILMIFTIILLTFELIKFFIKGRVEIYRSSRDTVLLLLGFSFLISSIFSIDSLVSFWGYEYRLGTGFVSIITILIYVLVIKSMIKNIRSVVTLIFCLSLGIFLSAVLSILSFYGFNPFAFIPEFEKFFLVGLPLFNSAKLSVVIWSVGIFLSFFVFHYFFQVFSNDEGYLNKKLSLTSAHRKKRVIQSSLLLVYLFFTLVFVTAISLFTIKNLFWVGALSLGGVFFVSFILVLLCRSRILQIVSVLILLISFSVFAFSRLPVAQEILRIDSENLVEQITLDSESIWHITLSSLSDSSVRSLVGLGNDNFVIAYNLYRPAFSGDIDLNFVNYSYANNEVYNIVANRGFVGIFTWLIVGFLILSQFFKYLGDETRKKMIPVASTENVAILLFDLVLIYIWLFSFVSYYSFILYFILFLMLGISSLLKGVVCRTYSEVLVIQTNFFVEKIGLEKNESLPKFFILLMCFVSIFLFYHIFNDFSSRIYAVRAESIMYDLDEDMDVEVKGRMLQRAIDNYHGAIERNSNNYVLRRKVGIILMDYIDSVLSQEYTGLSDDTERQEFVRVVGVYAEASLEETRQATDLAPMVGINWSTRDLIYSELVKMGFQNYINTALQVSEQTILRQPNNYNPYVNRATYLYLMGDADGAMNSVGRALEINPYYVPGLVLAGEISMGLQNYVNAKTYFENAKTILEEMDLRRTGVLNLYEQVQNNLDYLWSLETESSQPSSEEETVDEITDEELDVEQEEDLDLPDDEISD